MPYPDIVLYDRRQIGSTRRIPDRFPDDIDAMIVTSDEGNVVRDQDVVAEANIALDHASGAELHPVAELDDPVRRPNGYIPGNSQQASSARIPALQREIDDCSR